MKLPGAFAHKGKIHANVIGRFRPLHSTFSMRHCAHHSVALLLLVRVAVQVASAMCVVVAGCVSLGVLGLLDSNCCCCLPAVCALDYVNDFIF